MLTGSGRRNSPGLSEDAAGKLLANIMDTCGMRQASIPLKAVSDYSTCRHERYTWQIITLVLMLVVFILIPFLFVMPQVRLEAEENAAGYVSYTVTVADGIVPMGDVTADINGSSITVLKTDSRSYYVAPSCGGTLNIYVSLINGQYESFTYELKEPDKQNPVLLKYIKDEETGQLHITVSDDGVGLDYPNVAAYTESGERIPPLSIDVVSGDIIFDFPEESVTIYVPDKNGNNLELHVTLDRDGR